MNVKLIAHLLICDIAALALAASTLVSLLLLLSAKAYVDIIKYRVVIRTVNVNDVVLVIALISIIIIFLFFTKHIQF